MHPSACIAQAIGSHLGEAVMFCEAGEPTLHTLQLFAYQERGGFAGRRAFEKHDKDQQDLFYRTIQAVISNAVGEAHNYNRPKLKEGTCPPDGAVVFPIIVIDGELFEAYYEHQQKTLCVLPANHLRVYWRGSNVHGRYITPVDIVTAAFISEFARKRAAEIKILLEMVEGSMKAIKEAFKQRNFSALTIKPGPRGVVGLPKLLADLYLIFKSQQETLPQLSK